MSQVHEGHQDTRTPHQRAVDRHEAAVEAAQETASRAAGMVIDAQREVCEALQELTRYEKQPGIPLPVADQKRVEEFYVLARRRLAEIRGEDR